MPAKNGNDTHTRAPKRAPGSGPAIMVRFRTKSELNDVRRVAKDKGVSMNTYIMTVTLAEARNYLAYRG